MFSAFLQAERFNLKIQSRACAASDRLASQTLIRQSRAVFCRAPTNKTRCLCAQVVSREMNSGEISEVVRSAAPVVSKSTITLTALAASLSTGWRMVLIR